MGELVWPELFRRAAADPVWWRKRRRRWLQRGLRRLARAAPVAAICTVAAPLDFSGALKPRPESSLVQLLTFVSSRPGQRPEDALRQVVRRQSRKTDIDTPRGKASSSGAALAQLVAETKQRAEQAYSSLEVEVQRPEKRKRVAEKALGRLQDMYENSPRLLISFWAFILALMLPRPMLAASVAVGVYYATAPARETKQLDQEKTAANGGGQSAQQRSAEVEAAEAHLLNVAVQEMWPEITTFIKTVLQDSVEDAIQARVPLVFKGLGFGKIVFDDTALQLEQLSVEGVNQVCRSTGSVRDLKVTGRVVWDADVSVVWNSLLANVTAKHVTLKGQLAVYLKQILPRPPFFSGLRVYFTQQPSVALRLNVQALGQTVSPAVLEDLLADVIQRQLISQIVLPNIVTVLLDSYEEEAWFQLGRVLPEGVLIVHVQQARNLAAKGWGLPFGIIKNSSDPYCELNLGGETWTSPAKPCTLDPEWTDAEGSCRFLVQDTKEQCLTMRLYSQDWFFKHDGFLGGQMLKVKDLIEQGEVDAELVSLDDKDIDVSNGTPRVKLRVQWSELLLDEENTRNQLSTRLLSEDGGVSMGFWSCPSFVLFIGVDCCYLPDAGDKPLKESSCQVEIECENSGFEAIYNRSKRKVGSYNSGSQMEDWQEEPTGASAAAVAAAAAAARGQGQQEETLATTVAEAAATTTSPVAETSVKSAASDVVDAARSEEEVGDAVASVVEMAGVEAPELPQVSEVQGPAPSPRRSRKEGGARSAAGQTAHFQRSVTHMLRGDPNEAKVKFKVRKGGVLTGSFVGEAEFSVSRLLALPANTETATLYLGPRDQKQEDKDSDEGEKPQAPRLKVLLQMRSTRPVPPGTAIEPSTPRRLAPDLPAHADGSSHSK
eukprot:TRINITY_DN29830_c0_g1_i5.p1 TRINITY_DN29830_c0_g1~~TRINITY_DN29830_c0_g1_i5.p1  ORF type:complete len:887 (-),score=235.89 TRINITY_DN29830_c0_g1_i5:133-2793(-)